MKPLEVEILVAEVGVRPDRRPAVPHPLRRHSHGRDSASACSAATPTSIATRMEATFRDGSTMVDALRSAVAALAGPDRQLVADDLEVAVLGRSNGRRRFRRLADAEVAALLLSEASEPAGERTGAAERKRRAGRDHRHLTADDGSRSGGHHHQTGHADDHEHGRAPSRSPPRAAGDLRAVGGSPARRRRRRRGASTSWATREVGLVDVHVHGPEG